MDDDHLVDVNFTDLDLNQEPTDLPLADVINELESTHWRMEVRIRQLEDMISRGMRQEMWRLVRQSMEISGETMANTDAERDTSDGNITINPVERMPDRDCKRDNSHLVSKALEMNAVAKKADKDCGSIYDCNICLNLAKEPVLTCCGHLFCWPCFYQVSFVDSTTKECPVCKGVVSNDTIIPIYGNGGDKCLYVSESGMNIPPRPKARRVESLRQQLLTNSLTHVPVAEALRRIRISIGEMGNQTLQQERGSNTFSFGTDPQVGQNGEAAGSRHLSIHQVSRALSESAASLSSLSSALSNAETLVEDFETHVNNRRNSQMLSAVDTGNPSVFVQSNNQPLSPTSGMNATSLLSQSFDASSGAVHVVWGLRADGQGILPDSPSVSLRRRSMMSRTSDVDGRDSRESRRRRLN